jgi:hypothetical protein
VPKVRVKCHQGSGTRTSRLHPNGADSDGLQPHETGLRGAFSWPNAARTPCLRVSRLGHRISSCQRTKAALRCELSSNGRSVRNGGCVALSKLSGRKLRSARLGCVQIPDPTKPTFAQHACTRTSSCCMKRMQPSTYRVSGHQEAAACRLQVLLRRIDRRLLRQWQQQQADSTCSIDRGAKVSSRV